MNHHRNFIALTPAERARLGRLAQTHSLRAVARMTQHTRRTVTRWARRFAPEQSYRRPTDPLTAEEKGRLLQAAPTSIRESLTTVARRAGVRCHSATLSRLYRRNNIFVSELRLATYTLKGTRHSLKVINPFYAQPRNTSSFRGPARLVAVQTVPFYAPRHGDGFLYSGYILPVSHPLFTLYIEPRIGPQGKEQAWFLQLRGKRSVWHVIQGYGSNLPVTHCGYAFPPQRQITIHSPGEKQPAAAQLCRRCMGNVLRHWARYGHLKPQIQTE